LKKGVLKKQVSRKYSDFEKFYGNIKMGLEMKLPMMEFRFFKKRKVLSVKLDHITRILVKPTQKQIEKVKKLITSFIFEELNE
jgi:hypothetical protein